MQSTRQRGARRWSPNAAVVRTITAQREGKRDVAGASGEIENRGAWRRPREIEQPAFPAAVLAVGQGDRDEVVAIGDRRKQRADVVSLPLGGGDPIPQAHAFAG